MLFSSYLGGSSTDIARDAVLDVEDKLWICGSVGPGFPTTPDAIYTEYIGGGDAAISIVNLNTYTLSYSTYWGGQSAEGADDPYMIQLLEDSRVAICGGVYSNVSQGDLPTTLDAFQQEWQGGRHDGFFAILDLESSESEYCTFVGGNGSDFVNYACPTSEGVWALTGSTSSPNFPVTDGTFDATFNGGSSDGYVLLLDIPSTLIRSTFLGGSSADYPFSLISSQTYVSIVGQTRSSNFPVTHGAFDTVFNNNGLPNPYGDYFISRLNWSMTELQYSTFFGGFHTENWGNAKFENDNIVWLVGETGSTDLSTTPNSLSPAPHPGSEGFIFRFAIDTTGDTTSVSHNAPVPNDFALSVFPNPFNPTTTLAFNLPNSSDVELVVHDVLGREVMREALGQLAAGQHSYFVDGSEWASGIYFATVRTNLKTMSVKLALVK